MQGTPTRRAPRKAAVAGLALAAGALVSVPTGALTAEPKARPAGISDPPIMQMRILTSSQRTLLRTGSIRVKLTVEEGTRVRLVGRARRNQNAFAPLVTEPRHLRFPQTDTRTVRLQLTRFGRRYLRFCTQTQLEVTGRAKRTERQADGRTLTQKQRAKSTRNVNINSRRCTGG